MMLELCILIIGIAAMMYVISTRHRDTIVVELFEDEAYLYSCPSGYTSYHLPNGNTACCKGEIVANTCVSNNACMLNGKETDTIPKCTTFVTKMNAEKASTMCPPSMSTYYESGDKKGCTKGPLNPTMTEPRNKNQPQCTIYDTMDKNLNAVDSCSNQKEMEEYPCFGTNCTKSVVQTIEGKPAQIAIGFMDTTGVHRVAYTRASMERFLDATKPNWRNQGMDLDRNITVAEVAKAYYVDRTIQQDAIQV